MERRWRWTTQFPIHSLRSNELQVLSTSPMQCTKQRRNSRTTLKYADLARGTKIMNSFDPLVAESLGGLGSSAIKLFAERARSQASSKHPVGHILRRLIIISQYVAVQKSNFRTLLQKAVSLCSLDDPSNSLRVFQNHLIWR
jgi:hypothetical protein